MILRARAPGRSAVMWESSRGSSRDPVEPAGVQLDHFEGWDATTDREGSSRSAPGRDRRPTIETGSAISERRAVTSSRERVATQVSEPPPAWHSSLSTPPGSHPRETSSRTGPPPRDPAPDAWVSSLRDTWRKTAAPEGAWRRDVDHRARACSRLVLSRPHGRPRAKRSTRRSPFAGIARIRYSGSLNSPQPLSLSAPSSISRTRLH